MKLKFELSNLAKSDLEEIWFYTLSEWLLKQANTYYKLIFLKIDMICKNPMIGKSISNIKTNHFVIQVESHLIVYQLKDKKVLIDRILLKRMGIEDKINE